MKILLVSNGFYPEISPRSFRATELAKEFCRQEHNVVVFSKYRDHDYSGFLEEFPIRFKMWRKPFLPEVPHFRQRPLSFIRRIIWRLLSLLFEYPGIEDMFHVKKMLVNESGYDLLISFAVPYPVHWGVAWARSKGNPIARTWIADCGDPYMFARLDTFKKPFYFKFLEKNFCRECDYISIPIREMKFQFYPEFVSKIKIIPQGFNLEDIRLSEKTGLNEKPVFIYAGTIIPRKRDLSLFLDFLSTLTKDFLFIVYTYQPDWFNKFKIVLGKKLELRNYIERLSLIYEMSKADFLVNVDTVFDDHVNTEAVPSKLIDYALTRRPILNISSAHLDKKLVLEFLNGNYFGQKIVDITNYDIRKVSKKFLELID